MNPLISVVIPVYQTETYLRRCVSSVLAQTLKDWEIILVDDGSKDGAGAMCDAYAAEDPRIHTIHQQNQGLGAARNTGMKQCRGKYLYFLDSDDYLDLNAFSRLYDMMKEKNAQIVMAGHSRAESDGQIHDDSAGWPECPDDQAVRTAVIRNQLPNFAWGKLYLRSLWEGIDFPRDVLVEDMYVMPRVFVRASHIEVIREPLYFYSHENKNSIMNGTGDQYIRIRYGRFGGWKIHEEAAAEICPEWQDECAEKAVRSGIRAYMLNEGGECAQCLGGTGNPPVPAWPEASRTPVGGTFYASYDFVGFSLPPCAGTGGAGSGAEAAEGKNGKVVRRREGVSGVWGMGMYVRQVLLFLFFSPAAFYHGRQTVC